MEPLLSVTPRGLYCAAGDFYIDPWEPVDRAVVTHAHGDHLHPGSRVCVTARPGAALVAARAPDSSLELLDYGEPLLRDGVRVSLHPAGHILGSAQVRIEQAGEIWVVSGDYKLEPDPTCTPFETIRCHTFLTESTFGLPVYRWRAEAEVFADINGWWRDNQAAGKASVLFAYALGKAQRVLAGLDPSIGPVFAHGLVERYSRLYRQGGIALPATTRAADAPAGTDWSRALIIAPPMAANAPWLRRFGRMSAALASGWMRIRGTRRRRSLDRGFVLSDHADWPGLIAAIEATGAQHILTTHGYRGPLARWLEEKGLDARAIETRFEPGQDETAVETEEDA